MSCENRHEVSGCRLLAVTCLCAILSSTASAQYLQQEHYRWRNDNGNETGATWKAALDTALSGAPRGESIRLRFAAVNRFTFSYAFQCAPRLEYSTSTSGTWTVVAPYDPDGLSAFAMATTSGYSNQESTTTQLTGAGAFVAGRCVESPDNAAWLNALNFGQYSEYEYCFSASAKARGGTNYYFRLGGVVYLSYPLYATLTMIAGEASEAPAIKSALAMEASVATNLSYTILASGTEPIMYNATSLPPGLTFDGTNKITGNTGATGTYSIVLSAINAYGSATNTLVIGVVENAAPVAGNQTVSPKMSVEQMIALTWGDIDNPQAGMHTFTIVSSPSHGSLQSYFQKYGNTACPDYYYYTSESGYTGPDSFTWKCSDGDKESNVATCTINVANSAPTANPQTLNITGGIRRSLAMSYSDPDGAQPLTMTVLTPPSHGVLEVSAGRSVTAGQGFGAGTLYYSSQGGYTGTDSFTWKVSDGLAESAVVTCTVNYSSISLTAASMSVGVITNTPVTVQVLPAGLTGYWMSIYNYANPSHGSLGLGSTSFTYTPSAGYEGPDSFQYYILCSGASSAGAYVSLLTKEATSDWPMFLCDEHRSGITTMSLTNALYLQWRRDYPALTASFAPYGNYDAGYEPVVLGKRMFVGSSRDDSITALHTDTGAEIWKYTADGPIRVAPVAWSNKVFVSSDDGYFYCLNASDGSLIWKKTGGNGAGRKVFGDGRIVSVWPCRGGALEKDGKVYFAAGLWPHEGVFVHCLDAATGAVVWRNDALHAIGANQAHGDGSYVVSGFSPMGYMLVDNGQLGFSALRIPCGRGDAGSIRLDTGAFAMWAGHGINGGSASGAITGSGLWPNWQASTYSGAYGWLSGFFSSKPVGATAGSASFGQTQAAQLGVSGSVYTLLAADNKLFVVTTQGSIYCFGPMQSANPPVYTNAVTALSSAADGWKDLTVQILGQSGIGTSGTGAALVWGIGSGRLVEELAMRSALTVDVYDTDALKVSHLRAKLAAADCYGRRVAVHTADPMDVRFSPSLARLITSEDVASSGFASGVDFVKKAYQALRPNGGAVWLPTDSIQNSQFASWTNAAGVANADLSRSTPSGAAPACTVLKRLGLPKALAQYMRPPWGVLYWGNASSYYAFSGGAAAAGGNGSGSSTHTNTISGLVEGRSIYRGYGCAGSLDCGNLLVERSGAAAIYDYWSESGTFHLGGLRPPCTLKTGTGMNQMSDGTIMVDAATSCSCNYSFRGVTMAVMPMPDDDVENYVAWYGPHRSRAGIEETPVKRLGVNFGGPGVWKDADQTVWVPQPPLCRPTPELRGTFTGSVKSSAPHFSRFTASDYKTRLVASSFAKGISSYRIYVAGAPTALQAGTAPTIDGNLSDACWNGQKETELTMESTGYGSVWLRYDAVNLYIGFQKAGDYRTATGMDNGFHFYLCSRSKWDSNARFSVCSDGVTYGVTNQWTVAKTVSPSAFTAEMCLPWNTVTNLLGFNRDQLVVNFYGPGRCRIRCTREDYINTYAERPDGPNYYFTPMFLDATGGEMGTTRDYLVRLYFVEPEGLLAGQRVFDVRLQGTTVLSDFDVTAAAGGTDIAVTREFAVSAQDKIELALVSKVGETIISGMEILPYTGPVAPAITSVLTASAVVGQNFNYTITANGTAPIAFGATGLPSGLSISNAVISGVPLLSGTNSIALTATNAAGSDTDTLVLIVRAGPTVAAAASSDPDPVTGLTATMSVLGADDGGEANLTYTWTTNGAVPGGVSFSPNGNNAARRSTATFTKAGAYYLKATITDGEGLSTQSVASVMVNQTAISMAVNPPNTSMTSGGTKLFTASGIDQFGDTINASCVWSVSGGGTISTNGLFSAATVGGPYTVYAVYGTLTGTAQIVVLLTNNPPTVAAGASADPDPVTGLTATMRVLGADDGGEAGLIYTWTTNGAVPAAVSFSPNGNNAARSSTATFRKAGAYNLKAIITDGEGVSTQSDVTVTVSQALTTIIVSPASVNVTNFGTKLFTAGGMDQFGDAMSLSSGWSVSGGGTIDGSGLFTATTIGGPYMVYATNASVSGTAQVSVISGAPAGPTEFICALRASGGDYTTMAAWQNANKCDLTSSGTKVFSHGGITGGPFTDGESVRGSISGTGMVAHVTAGQILFKSGGNSFIYSETVTGNSSGASVVLNNNGAPAIAVLECYNDWPTGLSGLPGDLSGWSTDSSRHIVIRTPLSERHNGTPTDPVTGDYTGFAVKMSSDFNYLRFVDGCNYTRVEGLIIVNPNKDGSPITFYRGSGNGVDSCIIICDRSVAAVSVNAMTSGTIRNTLILGQNKATGVYQGNWGTPYVYNCTIANCSVGISDGVDGNGTYKNNIIYNCATPVSASGGTFQYNATDKAALPSGTGNRTNQTFTFKDVSNNDYHLAAGDVGAMNLGTDLSGVGFNGDMDGNTRPQYDAWDIGMDELAGGVDACGIPDVWKEQYFGAVYSPEADASADPDGDGMNNFAEWRAGTNPTNAASLLELRGETLDASGYVLQWPSIIGRYYRIVTASNLVDGFNIIVNSNITATPPMNTSTVNTYQSSTRYFRLNVE